MFAGSIKQDGDKSCLLAISGLSRSYRDPVAVPTRLGGGRDRNSRDRKKALKPPSLGPLKNQKY